MRIICYVWERPLLERSVLSHTLNNGQLKIENGQLRKIFAGAKIDLLKSGGASPSPYRNNQPTQLRKTKNKPQLEVFCQAFFQKSGKSKHKLITPASRFLKDRGVGEGKIFLKKFSFPHEKTHKLLTLAKLKSEQGNIVVENGAAFDKAVFFENVLHNDVVCVRIDFEIVGKGKAKGKDLAKNPFLRPVACNAVNGGVRLVVEPFPVDVIVHAITVLKKGEDTCKRAVRRLQNVEITVL